MRKEGRADRKGIRERHAAEAGWSMGLLWDLSKQKVKRQPHSSSGFGYCFYVMLGGLTHEPVIKLAEKLQAFLPGDLDYCFFSDSGSVAVEVARQFNTNKRQQTLFFAVISAI